MPSRSPVVVVVFFAALVVACVAPDDDLSEPGVEVVVDPRALRCDALVQSRWNDPTVWTGDPATAPVWYDVNGNGPNAGLPPDGATVRIGADVDLRLDGTPRDPGGGRADLAGLEIAGGLYADCRDLNLRVDWIDVLEGATLQIGSEAYPYTGRATITLTRSYPGAHASMKIGARGATVDLHGAPQGRAWALLSTPAAAGTSDLQLATAVPWPDGARVAIASTDFEPEQAEECTITNLGGGHLRCDAPLQSGHWGGAVGSGADTVDASAEVMLLSRNLVIGVDASVADPAGQMIFERGTSLAGEVRLTWIEVDGLGQEGTMGLYPVHFHMAGDLAGSHVKHSSIHDTLQRAITVHETNDLELIDNVAYDINGHAFYLESGMEHGNLLEDNVVAVTRAIADGLPGRNDDEPASFYLSNPTNRIRGNRAAGSDAYGFYFVCLTADTPPGCLWPPPTEFSGNVAHSNRYNGLDLDLMPTASGDEVHLRWLCIPDGAGCAPARFTDVTAYKNGYYAAWIRTHGSGGLVETRLERWRVADNRTGFYLASGGWQSGDDSRTILTDSVVIGESQNLGDPDTVFEATIAGRSLPNVHPDCGASMCAHGLPLAWSDPYQAIVGVDVYDGHFRVESTRFTDFRTETWSARTRPAGAFSQTSPNQFGINHDDNPWAVDPRNEGEDLTFTGANPVYMRPALYWGESGAVTPVLRWLDGTGTSTVAGWVMPRTPMLDPGGGGATVIPGANAWLVDPQHAYAQVQVQNNGVNNDDIRYVALTARHNGAVQLVRSPFLDTDRFGFQALVGNPAGPVADYTYDLDLAAGPRCPLSTPLASCGITPVPAAASTDYTLTLRFGRTGDRITLAMPHPGYPQKVTFPVGAGSCTYDVVNDRLAITLELGAGDLYDPLEAIAVVFPAAATDPDYCGP